MNKIIIFDLDHTVINSEHRVNPCIKEGGDLDLNMYREQACTREQVYKDTMLPLAAVMLRYIAEGTTVIVLTARHMFKHDYDFLKKQGLKTPLILSRDKLYKHFGSVKALALYASGDAVYKGAYMDLLQSKYPDQSMIIYDDHKGVLEQARKQGVHAVDAIHINKRIATFNAVGFS